MAFGQIIAASPQIGGLVRDIYRIEKGNLWKLSLVKYSNLARPFDRLLIFSY